MTAAQAALIDQAARERADRWLAGGQLPEQVQRRIRPLLTQPKRKAA